jgi:hypothetical protein
MEHLSFRIITCGSYSNAPANGLSRLFAGVLSVLPMVGGRFRAGHGHLRPPCNFAAFFEHATPSEGRDSPKGIHPFGIHRAVSSFGITGAYSIGVFGPPNEFAHVICPKRRVRHGKMPVAGRRPLLNRVLAVPDRFYPRLKNLEYVRIELIV